MNWWRIDAIDFDGTVGRPARCSHASGSYIINSPPMKLLSVERSSTFARVSRRCPEPDQCSMLQNGKARYRRAGS